MACCAFTVFLLGQLYMSVEAVARALGITCSASERPTATDWHWGAGAEADPVSRWKIPEFSRRLALAGSLSAVALTIAVVARPHAAHFDLTYLADPSHICRAVLKTGTH